MAFQVWVRLRDQEWTFTEDPDSGEVADDITVLTGLSISWLAAGPLWPDKPAPMRGRVSINLPDFSAGGFDGVADGDWLAVEVKLDATDPGCVARFYGDVTDYQAVPRPGRAGVTLQVEAIDYRTRLAEEYHATYVVTDDGTPTTDHELADRFYTDGELTGLGDHGTVPVWPTGYSRELDDAYLNLDGPLSMPAAEFLDAMLVSAVDDGTAFRMILTPMVAGEDDPANHGARMDGVVVTSSSGAYYTLDRVAADPLALPRIWDIPGDAVAMDTLQWENVKGVNLAYVTTSGWGGLPAAKTASLVTGATGVAGADVPVFLHNEADAQNVGDFYAARQVWDPWQLARFTIPATRYLNAGGDLNTDGGTLELFPDWTLPEIAIEGRAMALATGLIMTEVDPTRTPDGETFISGVMVGAECNLTPSGVELVVSMRRGEVDVPGSRTATITVAHTTITANLTAFVTRVDLSHITDASWWAMVDSNGGNIAVSGDVGGVDTPLPFDLTRINTVAKTGELFLRGDLSASVDKSFYLTVTPGGTPPAPTDPTGRNACWQDYAFVTIPSADYANGLTVPINRKGGAAMTLGGAAPPTISSAGLVHVVTGVGYALASGVGNSTIWTCGFRAKLASVSNTARRTAFAYTNAANNAADRAYMAASIFSANRYQLINSTSGNLSHPTVFPNSTTGVWQRWAMTHNGTTARTIRANGGSPTSGATAARPVTAGDKLYIGNESTVSTSGWDGTIDYFYLRLQLLSDAWLAAEKVSWETPASFYTVT